MICQKLSLQGVVGAVETLAVSRAMETDTATMMHVFCNKCQASLRCIGTRS